jgi:PEP-CTERM motif
MRIFVALAATAAMCMAAPALAKGNKGNGNPGNGQGNHGSGNGGSNSAPVVCNAATDLSIAAISCSGFYSGNLLDNTDTAAQVTGLAQIGFSWDGNFSALEGAGMKQDISGTQLDLDSLFGTMAYGITVIGIHFGGGGPNGVGNGTAFYKFDAGTDGTKILALNYPGSSGIALYSTGHAPIVPPLDPPPGDDTTVGVPEPASWMTMVGGFGLIGGGLRRRRRATRFA